MASDDNTSPTEAELEQRADDILRALGYAVPEEPIADTPQARMRWVIPHMRAAAQDAVKRAQPGAVAELAVLARNPDGSGAVGSGLDLEMFFADVEALCVAAEGKQDSK